MTHTSFKGKISDKEKYERRVAMATKYITFNYFEPLLVPAQQALELSNDDEENYRGDLWNMRSFMDFLATEANVERKLDFAFHLGDEYADVEPGSFINRNSLYHIQFSKLRDKNIPAKKRIGQIKEELNLQDDEYIGEFNSVVYDKDLKVLMVQSNHYGLSTAQLELYLTELRFRHLNFINGGEYDEENPLIVKLNPIIDPSQLQKAFNANYYRKIKIRCADFMEDALIDDQNDLISDLVRTLFKSNGATVEILLSLGRAPKTGSLDEEVIHKTLKKFKELPDEKKPNLELTLLENEEAQIETINLIRPRISDRVPFNIQPRHTIGFEHMFEKMIETYINKKQAIRRVVVRNVE